MSGRPANSHISADEQHVKEYDHAAYIDNLFAQSKTTAPPQRGSSFNRAPSTGKSARFLPKGVNWTPDTARTYRGEKKPDFGHL